MKPDPDKALRIIGRSGLLFAGILLVSVVAAIAVKAFGVPGSFAFTAAGMLDAAIWRVTFPSLWSRP